MLKNDYNIQPIHSGDLTADSSVTNYPINWKPEYWIVVVRATAGYVKIFTQADRGGYMFRLDRGTWVLPFHNDSMCIETVGFSGWYDLYAVWNLDGLRIEA